MAYARFLSMRGTRLALRDRQLFTYILCNGDVKYEPQTRKSPSFLQERSFGTGFHSSLEYGVSFRDRTCISLFQSADILLFRYMSTSAHVQNSWDFQYNQSEQNQYWHYPEGPAEVRQHANGAYSETYPDSPGHLNDNYSQENWQSPQIPNNHDIGNSETYQRIPESVPCRVNADFGQYQQSAHFNQYQVNPNFSQYQQSANFSQHQMSLNFSQYPQNTNFSQPQFTANIGQFQQDPDELNHRTFSQVSKNDSHEKSTEVPEDSTGNATLEALNGFCKEGKVDKAVEVLGLLEKQGIPVDLPQFLRLMRACGEAEALQEAKAVHEHIMRAFPSPKVSTYNRILEMYSKCGSMDDAFDVFNKMPKRNLTSWDTMITWLAKNGLGEDAIDLFSQFKNTGLKPDGKLFIGVFVACRVLGDANEGMLHFESMSRDYGIAASMEHYVSIVDMLAGIGHLDEALEFIEKIPLEPSVDVWETLMNLCRIQGHLKLGDRCAELVGQLDPSRLNEQAKVGLIPIKASDLVKEKEKKLMSHNIQEVRSRVHEFRAGDTSHPESDKLYAQLRCLKEQMKESGYIPDTRFVLHDIDQESKDEAIHAHSERLAVARALISSPARSSIRVIKNLRICGDCHVVMKIISKLVGRELIIRDAKRFHHFKDGLCSCRDYW